MPANPQIVELARRIRKLERQALIRKQPQLANSSIEDGALTAVDVDGNTTMVIGAQYDGTNGSVVVVGPTPPAPTQAIVTNETPGGLTISWDGTFADDALAPMDWARVSVHVAPDSSWDAESFDPQGANMPVASISSATGGQAWVPTEPGVDTVVVLTAWSTAGKMSALSPIVVAQSVSVGLDTSAPEWIALMEQAAAASGAAAAAQAASALAADAAQAAGVAADEAGQAAVLAQDTATAAANAAQAAADAAAANPTDADLQAVAQAAADAAQAAQDTANDALQEAGAAAGQAALAGSLAVAAQQSADGKNTVIYSTAPPGNAENKVGDTWFVRRSAATATESAGTVYAQYEGLGGTSWVKRELSSAVFAAIDAGKITFGTMSGERIEAGSIVISQVSNLATSISNAQTNAVTAAASAASTTYGPTKDLVTGWSLTGKTTINGGKIETDTITAAQIIAGAITASELAVGAVIAEKIAAGEVKAEAIAAGAIVAEKIAAGAITAIKIAVGAVTAANIDAQSVATAVLKAGVIQSQLVMTGAIQVGQATWNTTSGFTIPQKDGGAINFPVDGSPATIYAHLIARSLNVVDGLTITGLGEVKGDLVLTNGITKPSQPPRLAISWPSVVAAGFTSSPDASEDQGGIYTGLTNHHSNSDWAVAAVNFFGAGLRLINKRTGAVAAYPDPTQGKNWVADFYPDGGVVYSGGYYFVLGSDGARGGDYYVYRIESTGVNAWQKTAEVRVGSLNAFGGYTARMGPANQGSTAPAMYWPNSAGGLVRRTYNTSLSTQTDTELIANMGGRANIGGVAFEGANANLHVQTRSGTPYYFEFDVRQTSGALARAGDANVQGLVWDAPTGKFIGYDNYGRIWYYSGLMVPQTTVKVAYSWYDGDGTVRETEVSDTASIVATKGKWVTAMFDPPPDEKVTDPARVDKANRTGIYAATGTNVLRLQRFTVTPTVSGGAVTNAEHSWVGDIPTVNGKTAETSNGFAVAGVTNAPGIFRAASGGFTIDGASGGSVGTGTFRDSISALVAATISDRFKGGIDTITIATNGTPVSKTVTFATPFPASGPVPIVEATVRSGTPQLFSVSISGESRTGFTATMNRTSGAAAANFSWTASAVSG